MACFGDINVSQGTVATYMYARCGGTLNIRLTANLPVENFFKSVKIWQNYDHESVAPFVAHPVHEAALARSDAAKIRCNFSTEKLCGLLDIFISFRLISKLYQRTQHTRRADGLLPPMLSDKLFGSGLCSCRSVNAPRFRSLLLSSPLETRLSAC